MAYSNTTSSGFPLKWIIGGILLVIGLLIVNGITGKNNDQSWQIAQSTGGAIEVIDRGGYYFKGFSTVWTYPKYEQLEYTSEKTKEYPNDDSVEVTFNDGGTAKFSSMVRIQLPTLAQDRILFHRQFAGNIDAVRSAVKGHLINALKSTGPLMSASEHQTSRKSEYAQVVQEQLSLGLYEMKRVERLLKDQIDTSGKPTLVFATEIIMDEKGVKPKLSEPSPLSKLGINVVQFSITGTEYDPKTREQFATKKEAFLAAENSKAQQQKEVQQRLMVVEKGLREKAEIEAESNKLLAAATIKANQERLVAETRASQEKTVAETEASKLVAVALQTKAAAETAAAQEKAVAELKAQQQLEVSRLERQAAEENAKKEIVLADAKKQSLLLGGAISEKERVLAEISAKRDIGVAEQLSKIATPSTVINGGNGTGNTDGNNNLLNLVLLKSMGVIPDAVKK